MKKRKGRILGWSLATITFLGFFSLFSWFAVQSTIESTSEVEFCISCHSMQPIAASFLADVHGGNSSFGVQAACTDCHVTHDSLLAHVAGKARSGSHDIWVEFTQDTDAIDWAAKRAHREEFVYDSGCLTCHSNLQAATAGSNKAFVAHKPYFDGDTTDKCVTCHPHVGHTNLEATFINK